MGEVLIFYILGYTGNLQHFNVKYVLVVEYCRKYEKNQFTMAESIQFNFEVNKMNNLEMRKGIRNIEGGKNSDS